MTDDKVGTRYFPLSFGTSSEGMTRHKPKQNSFEIFEYLFLLIYLQIFSQD